MRLKKIVSLMLAVCIASVGFIITGCGDSEESSVPAEYGTYGAEFARNFAQNHKYRKAYTEGELSAGEYIKSELTNMGYEVETQSFTGTGGTSQNYIVRIDGNGFMSCPEGMDDTKAVNYVEASKTAVIGAHYDGAYAMGEVPEGYDYDGIDDNASGVGCLMTIANQIQNYENIGFDVILVFFGAGFDNNAGSNAFYNSLSEEEKASIEVMYCVDSIYAGDKVYASAGLSSLDLSRKYQLRRKLYQAYDVAYDNTLAYTNNFSLLYNESTVVADVNGDGVSDVYREVSIINSDYTVFDNAGIAVVFFNSYDYNFDDISEMKQTKNLNLQEFGGQIGGTYLDSMSVLDPVMNTYIYETPTPEPTVTETDASEEFDRGEDKLQTRINNIAFVILESLGKGSDQAISLEDYEALQNATPTPEDDN